MRAPRDTCVDDDLPHGRIVAERSDHDLGAVDRARCRLTRPVGRAVANFDAMYGPISMVATLPPIEPMNTIRPPAAWMNGSAALVTATCPGTFTSSCSRHISKAGTPAGRPCRSRRC
ncbi:MAG TPA: hypothetical protein VED20_12715 [Streptosporangiaceae bacterium]|nr:hypothetical protein [Streptosporangiaceae bacterium]